MYANYITEENLATELGADTIATLEGDHPGTVGRLITDTAARIRRFTAGAIYDTNLDGSPSNPELAEVFKRATIAHLATVAAAGISHDVLNGGASTKPRVASTSENGASITFDYAQADASTTVMIGGGLAPAAERILADVGLTGYGPGVIF